MLFATDSGLVHLGSARGSRAAIGGLANRPLFLLKEYPFGRGVRDEAFANSTRAACTPQNKTLYPKLGASLFSTAATGSPRRVA